MNTRKQIRDIFISYPYKHNSFIFLIHWIWSKLDVIKLLETLIDHFILERTTAYYRGDRVSNAILFMIGAGAIVWTFLLFIWRQGHLSTGLFFSASPLAMFYIVTSTYRFIRSIKRFKKLTPDEEGRAFLVNEEVPYLKGRARRFMRKRQFDLTGLLIGFLILVLSVAFQWNHIFLGTAISITVFSAILLAFDLFGQFHTEELLYQLSKYTGA